MKTNDNGVFPCSGCGACCKRVHLIPDFPEPVKEDGSCIHLQSGNLCAIYETRPLICRVDAFYDKFLKEIIGRAEFYQANTNLCEQYQKEDAEHR